MNIDWSKAPEGTTHYAPGGQGMRQQWVKAGPTGEEFDWYSWNEHANCWSRDPLPGGGVPIKRPCVDSPGQIQFAKDLFELTYRTGAPLNRSESAWVATRLEELGYRKFEIVEEDV